ncbi:MAG TPA: hypothetical protein VG013_23945, partial [Gemmataceae bacterium]|nr:hypothetical protein [Gemmataceae bacterium]
MNLHHQITRRQMLAWAALGGVVLGQPARTRADKPSGQAAKYPADKALRQAEKEGWVIEYTRADVRREGTGLRAPSSVPAERFVVTPAVIEARFEGKGKCQVIMPSFAHVCNQTCLASKVEVEADDEPLKRGLDYTLKPLVTTPLRNRFWQVGVPRKEKSRLKIRVLGVVSNAAEPADLKAAQQRIAETAARANQFDKKHKVAPAPHWMKKQSTALQDALSEVCGDEDKKPFTTLEHILQKAHKKAQLTKDYDKDLEKFVKDGLKGPCGANAEFVNLAATTAGHPCLFYTEGFVMVPSLGYGGLHAWNTACVNGFFIADSLNPALVFPEYAGYVATSVGRNVGHPGGANATTNGGWLLKKDTTFRDYYIYFSMFGYGDVVKDRLAKLKIPEGIQLLGDFAARQR